MLENLRFSQKIVLMPAVAGIAFLLIVAMTWWAGASNARLTQRIEQGHSAGLELGRDLETSLDKLQRGLQDSAAVADPEMLKRTDVARDAFLARLRSGRSNAVLDAGELGGLESALWEYYSSARPVTERMIAGETGPRLAVDLEKMRLDYNALRGSVQHFTERQRAEMVDAFATARRNQRQSMAAIAVITLLCLVALATLSYSVTRSLTTQLTEAVRVANDVALDRLPEVTVTSRDEVGRLLLGMQHMVVKVKEREAELRVSEERYALAARGANDGVWDWDVAAGTVYYSRRWKAMLGLSEDEVRPDIEEWLGRVHPDDIDRVRGRITAHLEGKTHHFECEYRLRGRDGAYRWMLSRGVAVRGADGQPARMAGSQTDISKRKQDEQQLLHDAFHDAMTELPNRALFMDRLRNAIRRAKRSEAYRLAVVFLDVDRFKIVNDSLGHTAGDELLKAIARRLEGCLRPGDTVARFGGDEFTMLLEDIGHAGQATRVAERVQMELAVPFRLQGQELFATASMGIAYAGSGYTRPEDLLRDADNAMYRAKSLGRARYEVFDSAMHTHAVATLRMESELRRAIERGELILHYQPIVSLSDGQITGFEALVRWMHPERGQIEPQEFIPMAEETGLIVPLGQWVLGEVCRQIRAWADSAERPGVAPVPVSANLSSRQFNQPDLVGNVREALAAAGARPDCLRLEVTESAVMESGPAARHVLGELKSLGIQLSIDDFGTGYSSLSYLHQFPVDTLKIDQSFVARLDATMQNLEIVRTVINLAHNLGMNVIAEGVETHDQARQLRRLGCEFAQGFLYSRPVDAAAAMRLVRQRAFARAN
jgi:diguanylate cyclase (GGDEF)-like protein/PAS domain S-box-containing protein